MGKANSNTTKKTVKDIFDAERAKTVATLIETIEQNPLTWQKEWAVIGEVRNGVSGSHFHGCNVLHALGAMFSNGFKDPRFCSFNQARKAGFTLKEGQKPVMILEFWKRVSFPTKVEDSDGNEMVDWVHRMRPLKFTPMYNFEQFEEVPELVQIESEFTEDEATMLADELIEKWVCPIKEIEFNDTAAYSPLSDSIRMPLREYFTSGESFLRTLLHEMTHSTGTKDRCNRDLLGFFGDEKYAKEELVAELGAMFSAAAFGFKADGMDSKHFENHAAYLQSWLKEIKNDPDYIFTAAGMASKASDFIYKTIRGEESIEKAA